jgi:hypothetical protein
MRPVCSVNHVPGLYRTIPQPCRAGLMFGDRPSGPGSDLRFIAGSHTPSKALIRRAIYGPTKVVP